MEISVAGESRAEVTRVIAFVDIAGYTQNARNRPNLELAAFHDGYYSLVAEAGAASGGRVVKYLGDGALLTWPEAGADRAVKAMLALRAAARRWMAEAGWRCDLIVKVHCGDVVEGPFGPPGDRRHDVIGNAVAIAARLETRSFAISADAFRRLSPGTRHLFKKHTPPVAYLPLDDPRP